MTNVLNIKRIWVYDLEVYTHIFTATFIHNKSDETRQFVISVNKDERKELFQFLDNEVKTLIGYNCIRYDSQILEFLYRNPKSNTQYIREYSDSMINTIEHKFSDVPEWELKIPHLDIFKALSLSTKAKRTSLKWCEYQMDFENIEDLPENGTDQEILDYNKNDVLATKELYVRYHHEIDLRKDIGRKEDVNLLNCTEPDIAKKLFLEWLSKKMNVYKQDLRNMGTDRTWVKISDVLLSYIKFDTLPLQEVRKAYSELLLHPGSKFKTKIPYHNIFLTYGLGGLHGSVEKTRVISDDKYIIKSCDVTSFYPNIAIRNKLHPEHIPREIFCELYENLYNERKKIPKTDPVNYILKICLNSLFGMTNDKYSFLRDRKFTLAICVNGQLLLSMLLEQLLSHIPNSKILTVNTDGIELLIPRTHEKEYLKVSKQWENLTNLELEYADYKQMIIFDANNYLTEYTANDIKAKGKCEFEDIPLYKNKSHSIIPIAFYEYFINNKPIEETILNHTNIFDFCAGVRARKSPKKGQSWYELHSTKENSSEIKKEKLSKTVRYYISTNGKYLIKKYENNDWAHVEAPKKIGKYTKPWKVTYYNNAFKKDNIKDFKIDYSYYISKTREWITQIENNLQKEIPWKQQ